jgi:hypothetical protein
VRALREKFPSKPSLSSFKALIHFLQSPHFRRDSSFKALTIQSALWITFRENVGRPTVGMALAAKRKPLLKRGQSTSLG